MLLHLALGDAFRKSMSVSPIWIWTWTPTLSLAGTGSSHDLHHLYAAGRVSLQSGHGPAPLQLDLLPVSARPLVRTLSVIGHGEFCSLLWQQPRDQESWTPGPRRHLILRRRRPRPPPPLATLRRSTGWSRDSRPLYADHAELAATEAAALQAARLRRRPGRPRELSCAGRFTDGVEMLKDCTADAELRLESANDPMFARSSPSTPTCSAGPRRACRRTAAWSSSSRRATRACSGRDR